jgi:hypothetical protein
MQLPRILLHHSFMLPDIYLLDAVEKGFHNVSARLATATDLTEAHTRFIILDSSDFMEAPTNIKALFYGIITPDKGRSYFDL